MMIGQLFVCTLVAFGLYLLFDQLVLSARNRVLVLRPLARATLLGGRTSDFAAWQSLRMGTRAAAIDEARGILRVRSTWRPEILLDLGIVTAITRPIRHQDDGYCLDLHYRIDDGHLPQEVHLTFESQKSRDRWRAMLESGIKTARSQPRFPSIERSPSRAAPGPASGAGLL